MVSLHIEFHPSGQRVYDQWELTGLTGTLIFGFWIFALVTFVVLFFLSIAGCLDCYSRRGQISDSEDTTTASDVGED